MDYFAYEKDIDRAKVPNFLWIHEVPFASSERRDPAFRRLVSIRKNASLIPRTVRK